MYDFIERFYTQNRPSLIEGSLRPTKSYSKEPENYIEKLQIFYKKKKSIGPFTENDFANALDVTQGSNVVNETLDTMQVLNLVDYNKAAKNASFTKAFVNFVDSEAKPISYIFSLLCGVKSLDTISSWINLIICTLREGYLYGEIVDFPDDANKFEKEVAPSNKEKYLSRIKDVYGYTGRVGSSVPYTPNLTQRSLKQLINLGFIYEGGKTPEQWPTYKITSFGHNYLRLLNLNFSESNDTTTDNTKPDDKWAVQKIVFGAPGTGKTFIINKEAEKDFGTTADTASKDVRQNIAESIQNSDKTAASLFAIGFKYAVALKDENPKSLVQKFKVTYDGAYAINQGIRVVDFFSKLPEYDAEKIDSIIREQLEKLKNEHFLMQAGSAAIGLKYSEFFYGKSTGDIINDLNLSKTSSQASWIWNGAQSAKYFDDEEEEKEVRRYERVTFHPNYSYAQFVGTYKPVQDKNDNTAIRYEYIPGPFMRVYVHAMLAKQAGSNDEFLLIIEEINRANVAAVFGDVFQLLDRKNGVSEYPIAASEDVKKYLKDNGIDDCEELCLPDNMHIWATMNSADQGVFPMDTAFKRRWEFEYIGIDDNESGINTYEIPLQKKEDGTHEWVKWNDLRHSINDKLTEMKINEDKLLGPYFVSKEKLKSVDGHNEAKAEEFVKFFKSKVLMYLFEDAVKMRPGDLFNEGAVGRLRFSDICKKFDEIGKGIFTFKE